MPKQGDMLDLQDDGTAKVSFATLEGQRNFTIRRPLVFQWRDIQKLTEEADDQVQKARELKDGTADRLLWDEMVYGHIFCEIASKLADQEDLTPENLPMWAVEPATIRQLVTHWRTVPLLRGGKPEVL